MRDYKLQLRKVISYYLLQMFKNVSCVLGHLMSHSMAFVLP